MRTDWKHKSEEVKEMGIFQEDRSTFVHTIRFIECEPYTQDTALVDRADQGLQVIVPYEA